MALTRALVIRPTVLLLDEPTSNLDQKLREDMRLEIFALQRRLGIATILVTHDQEEALSISDTMIVMNNGCIEQMGTPTEIYDKPATRFVASFIGNMNFVPAKALANATAGSPCQVQIGEHSFQVTAQKNVSAGDQVEIGIRPERCTLLPASATSAEKPVATGKIKQRIFTGSSVSTHVTCGDATLAVSSYNAGSNGHPLDIGAQVQIVADMTDACAY